MVTRKGGFGRLGGLINRMLGRSAEADDRVKRLLAPTDSDLAGPFTREEGGRKAEHSALMFALRAEVGGPESTSFEFPPTQASGDAAATALPLAWPAPAGVGAPAAGSDLAGHPASAPSDPVNMSPAAASLASDPTPSVMSAIEAVPGPLASEPLAERIALLRRGLVATLVATCLVALWMNHRSGAATGNLAAATRMEMLSQRMAKAAQQVSLGTVSAAAELRSSQTEFAALLSALASGGDVESISASATSGSAEAPLAEVRAQWEKADPQLVALLAAQGPLTKAVEALAVLNGRSAALLENSERVAAAKLQSAPSAREVSLAGQLGMLGQRIDRNANALVVGSVIDRDSARILERDAAMFSDITRGLIAGSTALRVAPARDGETMQHLQALESVWGELSPAVRTIVQGLPDVMTGREATRAFIDQSGALLDRVAALSEAYRDQAGSARLWLIPLVLLALAAAALAVMLVRQGRAVEASRTSEAQARSGGQEEAILRLMNEMASLAEGDLSVRATVSDDMTGAIADSINYTIEGLSDLVARINVAAEQMASASAQANRTSADLLVATESQSDQIRGASESIVSMSRSIEEVSNSATRSADVAQQSLMAAEQGALAVHNSISGMNEIRGQIQDTAKRIKRLGESSQQIGEIVSLISDITERTQVLALNAAIQAAAAGDAGRGFTVVAEEVQRLAERSAGATGQISTIVRTIQTDTQDAVAAMERSTQQVVEGARLSDAAGKALAEIGEVSRRLASLIEGISQSAQDQVRTATEVTSSIQNILAINRQTSEGTRQTVDSVGELAALAGLLQDSVANFKLA
jgi:twitching motility protein PilJ